MVRGSLVCGTLSVDKWNYSVAMPAPAVPNVAGFLWTLVTILMPTDVTTGSTLPPVDLLLAADLLLFRTRDVPQGIDAVQDFLIGSRRPVAVAQALQEPRHQDFAVGR